MKFTTSNASLISLFLFLAIATSLPQPKAPSSFGTSLKPPHILREELRRENYIVRRTTSTARRTASTTSNKTATSTTKSTASSAPPVGEIVGVVVGLVAVSAMFCLACWISFGLT